LSACLLVRERTAELHARVEARAGFDGGVLTERSAFALLAGLADLSDVVLQAVDGPAAGGLPLAALDWPARRARLLGYPADLALLGQHLERSLPAPEPSSPADPAQLLGWLYVAEGASLGSVLIQRALVRQPWAAEVPLRSFQGHGAETGRRWRDFRAAADGWAAGDPDRAGGMVAGASAAFTRVERRMARALAAAGPWQDGLSGAPGILGDRGVAAQQRAVRGAPTPAEEPHP